MARTPAGVPLTGEYAGGGAEQRDYSARSYLAKRRMGRPTFSLMIMETIASPSDNLRISCPQWRPDKAGLRQ